MDRITPLALFAKLRWLDGRPLLNTMEPYRRRLFDQAASVESSGRLAYSLVLSGRAKKNWKTTDLVLAALHALLDDSPHGSQCYLLANDEDQASDDLDLAKLLLKANPELDAWLKPKASAIEHRNGRGFLEILPAQDAVGAHGKTFRFCGFDEIHGYRTWDILEAMQPDPHRLDAQTWITSYATLFHRPGVPLFDLLKMARAGQDPRLLLSWYAADFTTDPEFTDADPETRANPSRGNWPDADYLAQQKRRLPSHKFRRLHLNLPGLPEGSAFQPDPVMSAVTRGEPSFPRPQGVSCRAFVDMSGGSSDDATLAIGYRDSDGRAVVARVMDQGPPPPFRPRDAVKRFAQVLREWGISRVVGDRYAGLTFRQDFEDAGVTYELAALTKSELYEQLEPRLNGHEVVLPDDTVLEQQLLGLVWRGGRIDHQNGEHDDRANAAAGLVQDLLAQPTRGATMVNAFTGKPIPTRPPTFDYTTGLFR